MSLNNSYHSDSYSYYSHYATGFVILISVLVIGAVGLTLTTSLLWLGTGVSKTSLAILQSNQAKALASACAEEALQRVKANTKFTGSGSLTLGQGGCSYSVANQGKQGKLISTTGTVATVVRKVSVTVSQLTPQIKLGSWQEVP